MKILQDYDLTSLNTLQLPAMAAEYMEITTVEELRQLARHRHNNPFKLILGEGSNLLLTQDVAGLVIKISLNGWHIIKETRQHVLFQIASGVNWHSLVEYCVDKNWGGIENLAFIPGNVGAAPVQNIAAYGQNFSDVVESVEYFDWQTQELVTVSPQQCQFGYRDSIFKRSLKGRAIITKVTLRLTKNPELETSYYSIGGRNDSLDQELDQIAQKPYTIEDVFKAVVAIRRRKLPDWTQVPTVGSFFINPIVDQKKLQELKQQISGLQSYPAEQLHYQDDIEADLVKVPVGRLLDFLGWRGKQIGHCRVTSENAAIFTHDGQATGQEFYQFTQMIKADVLAKFGIELETEVVVV